MFEIIIKFCSRHFTFLARFGPISVKNLLKFSAICASSVIAILSTITFLGKFWLLHLPLPIRFLIISQVFLMLFLKVSINLEKCFLIASKNFLYFLYSVSLSSFLFLRNLLYRRCLYLEEFLMPLVIQVLFRSLAFILIFFVEKIYHIVLRTVLKNMCKHYVRFVKFQFLANQFEKFFFKIENRFFIKWSFVGITDFILRWKF